MATARRRRPARRRSRHRRTDALLVAAAVALLVVVAVARWVNDHRVLAITVGAFGAAAGCWLAAQSIHGRMRAHRSRWLAPTSITAYMAADPDEFEQQTAALCRRDGCRHVRVVGGAGDLAADVLADLPDGRRMLVQCKRYALHRSVGSPDVQRVGGTYAVVHHADLALVVTTGRYTEAAVAYARTAGIRLVDAAELSQWAAGGRPPWNR